MDMQSLTKKRR